ncbi:hypothetical protein [Caldimonas thermodepolymerans]|uniref:hypothetical protein n=1 Tax=Caldimonas thermodepolymerans TaxID=215580 RepID=UPI00249187A8|nr:hypothetical protein [Caldimonas thermodepolymerans]
MAELKRILADAVEPALGLLPGQMDSDRARLMLLAIGLQESRFEHRRQIGGPARGFWQFERAGGVQGVLRHAATRELAKAVCAERGVAADATAVYERLEHDDLLACAFARLLLWTDPQPLPVPGDASASWQYYLRTWRPGKPHRHTWDALYAQALGAVRAVA